MKALEKYIAKVKPNFEKGGKYEKWLPVFESFETFAFVPGWVTKKGAHIRDAMDLKRTMTVVVLALIPSLLFGMWNAGDLYYMSIGEQAAFFDKFLFGLWKVLPIIIVSYVAGLGTEFIYVYLRGHEIEEGYLVSGMLIPLVMPIDVPLWMVACASAFAALFGKEAFGGTGMNIVNPALLARAFLFFSYPSKISGDFIWIHGLEDKGDKIVDGFSGATPLGQLMGQTAEASKDGASEAVIALSQNPTVFNGFSDNQLSMMDMFIGNYGGSVGESSTLAILIGAVILLYTGIASARVMLSFFAGGLAMGLLFNAVAVDTNAFLNFPALGHLMIGGFAFGAVFMATDPVTAAQTAKGKIIYGFLGGAIALIIRCLNPGFPEGVMLAILLMNVFAPLIDHYVVQGNIKRRLKRMKVAA